MRRTIKGKISREEYVQKRKYYKAWCKEKKRHKKKEEKKIKCIGTEKEVWKYINRYRKKREDI